MSRGRLTLPLLLLLLAALLGACGGGDDGEAGGETPPPPPAAESAPSETGNAPEAEAQAPEGFQTYEVADHGFSIGVPEEWQAVSAEDVAESGALDELARQNPAAAPLVEALKQPNSPLKFLAIDPRARRGVAANVNVVVEDLPAELSLDEYEEASLRQLRALGIGEGDVERERIDLPAGEALRFLYHADYDAGGPSPTLQTLQYGFVRERRAYVVTYTSLPSLAPRFEDVFTTSAESFRFL